MFYLTIFTILALAVYFVNSDTPETVESIVRTEKMLIIDPGHGGEDGGAVSVNGVSESRINLAIALKMSALCDLTATAHILTRDSENIDYPADMGTTAKRKTWDQKQRVKLINDTVNAVLISVHQNKFSSEKERGPHVFYGKNPDVSALAITVQDYLNSTLYPENRRVVAAISEKIYLFKNIDCPAVLAECGFLSNHEEATLLETEEHQTKAALALFSAYAVNISS